MCHCQRRGACPRRPKTVMTCGCAIATSARRDANEVEPHVTRAGRRRNPDTDAAAVGPSCGAGCAGLLGRDAARQRQQPTQAGALLYGTPRSSPVIAGLPLGLERVGERGLCHSQRGRERPGRARSSRPTATWVSLYGAFHFLRLAQTGQPLASLDVRFTPAHEDPRAQSLGQPRIATSNAATRASRSGTGTSCRDISIRATRTTRAPTRRSASTAPCSPTSTRTRPACRRPTSKRPRRWPSVLRPYGVRVYLTARFSAPIELGGLKTADPLDPAVRAWWKAKVDEIYRAIPDFGGFLVKANSEGQPGPQDYERTHADGANMLAEAVAPHGGVVMWRAFVYSQRDASRSREAGVRRVRAARRQVRATTCWCR